MSGAQTNLCRADVLLHTQGLADSRSRAAALILAGVVLQADGAQVHKAGQLLAGDAALHLRHQPLPFVSRGGLKLAAALEHFAVPVQRQVCLDVGASTGGFTDCLLQAGASKVFALDVGHNQLAWRLRSDARVVVLERLNIRHAASEHIGEAVQLVVIDVSFISLRTVLPAALRFAAPGAHVVGLVKPQFEVGRARLGKAGIVRDPQAHDDALQGCLQAAAHCGLSQVASMGSPILGAKGNREFLLYGRLGQAPKLRTFTSEPTV